MTVTAKLTVGEGTGPSPGIVRSFSVSQTEGQHDYASVQLDLFNSSAMLAAADAPILFRWSASGVNRVTVGYADLIAPRHESDPRTGIPTLHILGATNVLRSGTQRAWSKTNPFVIASDILAPYQFGLEMDAFPRDLPVFNQTNDESDWQCLARLAKTLGYSLTNDNTTIRILNVIKELQRALLRPMPTLSVPHVGAHSTMYSFDVVKTGSPNGADYTGMQMSGVDRWGANFSYNTKFAPAPRTSMAPTLTLEGGGTFRTMHEAMIEAERVDRQGRYVYTAVASTRGTMAARPGSFVHVIDRDKVYGGYWYVTDVTQELSVRGTSNNTRITMVREALSSTRRVLPALRELRRLDPPKSRVVNGTWRSAKQWVHEL